jgi:hypothetical protein
MAVRTMHKHATVSLWQRAEDGSYEAESNGWKLSVRWTPESAKSQRGFSWEASGASDAKATSHAHYEEIELAMADAEAHAAKASPVLADKE